MAKPFIKYRSGYKYQLAVDYSIQTNVKTRVAVDTKFIQLAKSGRLTVRGGYAWDGPSGPVVDTKRNMRASLVHDALYQLLRQKHLKGKANRDRADKMFEKVCIADGVRKAIARTYYLGLKHGGEPYADPKNRKKVHRAP